MSTTVLVIAMIVIAVFIVGFAVVARLFIGKQKGYDAEVAEAAEEGRRPDEDNVDTREPTATVNRPPRWVPPPASTGPSRSRSRRARRRRR